MPGKEDYTRTILAFERDGKVVRFNFVAAVTSLYQQEGGQQTGNRLKREKLGAKYLLKHYPELVRTKSYANSMFPEISLNRNP
jgi:hypothetical protein